MTLAQKLKDLRKEFVNDMTTKMVNEFTIDLFDPMDKGGNLNETMRDSLLTYGYYDIKVAKSSFHPGFLCSTHFKFVDFRIWTEQVVKFWEGHGFKCEIWFPNDTDQQHIKINLP